jgi:hypothetical protein
MSWHIFKIVKFIRTIKLYTTRCNMLNTRRGWKVVAVLDWTQRLIAMPPWRIQQIKTSTDD